MLNPTRTLPLGTAVVYYNLWTQFENADVRQSFQRLPLEELRNLKPGDTIWVDTDPLSPQGKVYGFVKAEVQFVQENPIGHVKISYVGPGHQGMSIVERKDGGKFFKAVDETALAELVQKFPLALQISPLRD